MEFYCLGKTIILPVKRLCRGIAARLCFRKRGILMLSQDVQACEYEDVRIMWEMLKKSETNPNEVACSTTPKCLKNKPLQNAFAWARLGTCFSSKI